MIKKRLHQLLISLLLCCALGSNAWAQRVTITSVVPIGSPLSTSFFGATTSAQLAGVLSDETGTGVAVFGTAPTFTTSITDPLVIGGTGVTSTLTLRSTSGVGAAGADIIFQVGNNGATEAIRILNNANVGIGTSGPSQKLEVAGAGVFTGAAATLSPSGVYLSYGDTVDTGLFQSITPGNTYRDLRFDARNLILRTGTIGVAEAMRITTDGNLGVATTTNIDQRLTLLGGIGFTGTVDVAPDVVLSRGAANRLDLASGDDFYVVSGRIGIVGAPVAGVDLRVGDGTGTRTLRIDAAAASQGLIKWTKGGTDEIDLYVDASSSSLKVADSGVADLLEISPTIADTETTLIIRRDLGGTETMQRVTQGAADSGGTGFRLLRVPN